MNSQQNRWANYGIVLIIVSLIGAFSYWVSNQFERVKTTINKGYSLEAFQNPYLAAQQYLQKQSISTKSAIDITETWHELSADDTLIILNTRSIPEAYKTRVLDWIESGGHLIISAHKFWDKDYGESGDAFLDDLGVRLQTTYKSDEELAKQVATQAIEDIVGKDPNDALTDAEALSDANEGMTEAKQCTAYGNHNITQINYAEDRTPLQIHFGGYSHLADASGNSFTSTEYYPNHILQYNIGDGMITALSSYHIWENHNIGWYDHAYLLWLLTENAQHVWFIFNREADSLFTLIAQHLLEPFAAGLFLLALYLWYRSKRFGPMTPEPVPSRRSLLEHLLANARFHWRHHQMYEIVQKQREEIKAHFIRRHGNLHDQAWIFNTLAKASQLTPEQVEWALTTNTPTKEQDFTQLMRRLQRLRNAV